MAKAMKGGMGKMGKSGKSGGMGMKKETGFSAKVGKGSKGFGKEVASPCSKG